MLPGAARYLDLGPFAVRRGATYDLRVVATVPGWEPASENVTVRIAG